ncbi:MAG TPA: transposase [Cyclobacteriaceae bacterium]|nr:transposase [Cyclobacteriaceae bacterium]
MPLRGRTNFPDEQCFFVTTTCYHWYHLLATEACRQIIGNSINFLNKKYDSAILGYVIMPNHIHLIIYFKKTNQLSNWMRDLKKFTAVLIRQEIEKSGNLLLLEKLCLRPEGRTYSQRGRYLKCGKIVLTTSI